MKCEEIKKETILISPFGTEWKVVRRYAKDMWLILKISDPNGEENTAYKIGKCIFLFGDQIRGWSIKHGN